MKQVKIYQITNNKDDYIYIGGTFQKTLGKIIYEHKRLAMKSQSTFFYQYILDNPDVKFTISTITNCRCDNKEDLNNIIHNTIQMFKKTHRLMNLEDNYQSVPENLDDIKTRLRAELKEELRAELKEELTQEQIEERRRKCREYYKNNREKILDKKKEYYLQKKKT